MNLVVRLFSKLKGSFIVTLIISIYLTGTFSVFTSCFQSYHHSIFQQATKQLKEEETEKIFFTDKQFALLTWIEDNKEFEWNNKMFDVTKIDKTKEGYLIYCENDGLEEILISFLKSIKKEMEGNLSVLTAQPQFFQAIVGYSFSSNSLNLERANSNYNQTYQSIDSSIASPPPKGLLSA